MSRWLELGALALCGAVVSCSAASDDDASSQVGGAGSGGGPAKNPLGRARCEAPPGVSASPRDTQEAVALLNALPKPTSVACFVESLARPLALQVTSSLFSAQPALSAKSPRVFIKMGEGWASVVVDGDGSHLIEFGDVIPEDPTRSIKAELELPLLEAVSPSAAYDRVMFNETATTCGLCHFDERRADHLPFPNAYTSIAFKPRSDTYVNVEWLRAQAQSCDWQSQARRCEMLSALFDGGEVVELAFPSALPTFF